MTVSYRKINYSIRPAKNIERKMLCESFKRLIHIDTLESYSYVGFGSIYFSDFKIFHNELGINKMISIEKNGKDKNRVEFNKPYSFIDIRFNESEIELPKLSYKNKSIIWLDYDSQLSTSAFKDISTVISRLEPGSIFIISVNVDYRHSGKESFDKLKVQIGNEKFLGVKPIHINGSKAFSQFSWKLIDNEIRRTLKARNIGEEHLYKYEQLFNFIYSDDANMLTIGGIIYNDEIKSKIDMCNFNNMDFIMTNEQQYKIEIPNLTYKELPYLNSLLPLDELNGDIIIPAKDAKMYEKIYRYFPVFAESNL